MKTSRNDDDAAAMMITCDSFLYLNSNPCRLTHHLPQCLVFSSCFCIVRVELESCCKIFDALQEREKGKRGVKVKREDKKDEYGRSRVKFSGIIGDI